MKHTREQLVEDSAKATAWAAAARASGRSADADALDRLADAAACAAGRFATGDGIVKEEVDSSTAVIRDGYFSGSRVCDDVSDLTDCCPWTKCGICKGCSYKDHQWIFGGKRYECLTAWSCRGGAQHQNTRQEPAGTRQDSGGIIYRPQDIP